VLFGPPAGWRPGERAVIDAIQVTRTYPRGITALRDVTLAVDRGEFVFLTGPSGAGKSTLLRLLLREEVPSSGQLRVGGRDLAALSPGEVQAYRRTVGFVFQDFKLIPRKTVLENVTLVLRALGVPEPTRKRRALQVLQGVALADRLEAFPPELSGGEQQRVAIARALVNEPHLVLADEPTGNLDPDLARDVLSLFRDMNARGTTVLVATHDRELIKYVGRRTVSLQGGTIAAG
jgi:cell division transport system ATP-binding protein